MVKEKITYWITPGNPSYYDAKAAFKELSEIDWALVAEAVVGDIVYVYLSNPYKYVAFKTEVVKTNVTEEEFIDDERFFGPDRESDDALKEKSTKYTRLRLLETFPEGLITLQDLQDHGLNGVIRMTRRLTVETVDFIENVSKDAKMSEKDNLPLQIIYYGAPGTGKSHSIQQLTDDDNSVRITFHPDSDYASFVGAYKPSMTRVPVYTMYGNSAQVVRLNDNDILTENKIQYEFIPQAFLTAYVEAWRRMAKANIQGTSPEPFYLVIEEINRGNCAQIFGDLFQLLDRKDDGYSSYAIRPDKDIQKYLSTNTEAFSNKKAFPESTIPEGIRNGRQMILPPNLYILATMNTSDQSLFPIDSAFKRRWDWRYIPIAKGVDKETGLDLNWRITAGGVDWDWWSFLEKINPIIQEATQREDKKLGYFFARATDGVISAEQFVGKVIFYIWNDVFKDFGLDNEAFKDHSPKEGEVDKLTFDKFFMPDGEPNHDKVVMLLENLGVVPWEGDFEALETADDVSESEPNRRDTKMLSRLLKSYWQELDELMVNHPELKEKFYRFHGGSYLLRVPGMETVKIRFSAYPLNWHKNAIALRVADDDKWLSFIKEKVDQITELTGENYTWTHDRGYSLLWLLSDEFDFNDSAARSKSQEWLIAKAESLQNTLQKLL